MPVNRGNKQQGLWMAGFVVTRGGGDLWCLWQAGVGLSEQLCRLAGPQTLLLRDQQHYAWLLRGGEFRAGCLIRRRTGKGAGSEAVQALSPRFTCQGSVYYGTPILGLYTTHCCLNSQRYILISKATRGTCECLSFHLCLVIV